MAILEELPNEPESSNSLRNRQSKSRNRNHPSIPLVHPSELPPQPAREPLISPCDSADDDEGIEYSDHSRGASPTPSEIDELLRSGQLKIPRAPGTGDGGTDADAESRERDIWDEIFDTAILTIPFSFLYLLLDILVYLQYSFRPKLPDLFSHMLRAVPTLGLITWYTSKYASHPATTPLLMFASITTGTRLIWLMNKASWGLVTAQAPAMGAMWTLTIVQLPLSRAVLCLAVVAGWVWYTGMKLQT